MRCRRIGGVLILIAAMLCVSARASIPNVYSGTISGAVIDAVGQPAAGANVWLVVERYGVGAKVCQKTVADAAGRFAFPHVKLTLPLGSGETPALIARDAKGRIGVERPWPHFSLPGDPIQPNLQIRLLPSKDLEGRLVDAAGKPIAGASIEPSVW